MCVLQCYTGLEPTTSCIVETQTMCIYICSLQFYVYFKNLQCTCSTIYMNVLDVASKAIWCHITWHFLVFGTSCMYMWNTITTSSWTVHICIRLCTLDLIIEPEHGWIEAKSAFLYVCCMRWMERCLKKNTEYIQPCHLNFVECIWLDYELQSCRNRCWQQLKWHLL